MLENIKELEKKYHVGIEKDSNCIFLYSDEFEDGEDVKKFHTAVIDLKTKIVSIEYNHYYDVFIDPVVDSGDVVFFQELKDFIDKDICVLCNHWSLFSPREQWRIEKFTYEVVDFIKEVLTNEKEV